MTPSPPRARRTASGATARGAVYADAVSEYAALEWAELPPPTSGRG
jgi:hypothetical protein